MEKQVVTSGGRQHGSKSPVLFRLQSWCTKMHFTCHMCIMCIQVWDTSIWDFACSQWYWRYPHIWRWKVVEFEGLETSNSIFRFPMCFAVSLCLALAVGLGASALVWEMPRKGVLFQNGWLMMGRMGDLMMIDIDESKFPSAAPRLPPVAFLAFLRSCGRWHDQLWVGLPRLAELVERREEGILLRQFRTRMYWSSSSHRSGLPQSLSAHSSASSHHSCACANAISYACGLQDSLCAPRTYRLPAARASLRLRLPWRLL